MDGEAYIPLIVAALSALVAILKHLKAGKLAKVVGVLVEEVERLPETLAVFETESPDLATHDVKRLIESRALARGVGETLARLVKAHTK